MLYLLDNTFSNIFHCCHKNSLDLHFKCFKRSNRTTKCTVKASSKITCQTFKWTACFSMDLSGHCSRTYLFDCADILLQHARVQALDLSELLTYAIDAQRTEEDLRSTRNHRTRALHTHTVTSYSFHQFIMHSGIARHEALSKCDHVMQKQYNSRKSKAVIQMSSQNKELWAVMGEGTIRDTWWKFLSV